MTERPKGHRGPKTNYRPKSQPPVSVVLTDLGKQILKATSKRTGMSHGDVMEQLLRRFATQVTPFKDDTAAA